MKTTRFTHTVQLGLKNLMLRKLRSGLTILGIIFGVASVITMLAVGNGAAYEAQQRIKKLGSNNIIIESIKPSDQNQEQDTVEIIISYGLTRRDLQTFSAAIPGISHIAAQRIMNESIIYRDIERQAELIGTQPMMKQVSSIPMHHGRFLCQLDESQQNTVCVINKSLANELFAYLDPIGKIVRIKQVYYTIVGVTKEEGASDQTTQSHKIYIPISTMSSRYGDLIMEYSAGTFSAEEIQLHKVVMRMDSPASVLTTEAQIINLLNRTHKKPDYKLTIPLQLLKQSQETQKMFNIVLGSIAAISLLVGGIGIMNIMLATVTERTREIGLRRALGAKKSDIITQFMVEAVLLSLIGGLIGVLLGIGLPHFISNFTEMNAIISTESVILAFIISALTGIIFGIYPAAKSAQLDPIEALRNE
jgi:putative ABC transport system permease protein